MPINPYKYDQYVSPYRGSLADLATRGPEALARAQEQIGSIQAQGAQNVGNIQAQAAQQRGQAWANAAQQIGQIPQQIQQQKAQQQQQEFRAAQIAEAKAQADERARRTSDLAALDKALSMPGGRDAVLNATPGHLRDIVIKQYKDADGLAAEARKSAEETRKAQAEYTGYLGAQIITAKYDPGTALAALHHAREQYADDPAMLKQLDRMRAQIVEHPESVKHIADAAVLGSSYKDMILKPPSEIEAVDPNKDVIDKSTGAIIRKGTPAPQTSQNPTEASLALLAAQGNGDALKALNLIRQQQRPDSEPLVPIMRDGRPVLVPRSQAIGQTPANVREQGRNVSSGDANRLSDYETSLQDLTTLTKEIGASAGSTGTGAYIGANLPNAVTQLTGWGTEAKQKQAVIDRVKQVIGKALEGGVLRKEDEAKYEKILPTIGDVPAVVTSKLQGLAKAIHQRRNTLLENLSDANYDVSKYQTRQTDAPSPQPTNRPPLYNQATGRAEPR